MARGKQGDEWARCSSLIATIVNLVRDPKKQKKPYQPHEFDPTRQATKKQKKADGWANVKAYYEHKRNQSG